MLVHLELWLRRWLQGRLMAWPLLRRRACGQVLLMLPLWIMRQHLRALCRHVPSRRLACVTMRIKLLVRSLILRRLGLEVRRRGPHLLHVRLRLVLRWVWLVDLHWRRLLLLPVTTMLRNWMRKRRF